MLHIASRVAVEAATGKLLTQAATLDDTGLAAFGQDLSAIAGLLSREPVLRRTLSEATTDVQARAGIINRVLTGHVGAPALQLTDFAIRQDWGSGSDLRDAFRRLGRTAQFLRAERSGELDEVEDQLFRFGRIVDGAPELSVLLDDPTLGGQARVALVRGVLSGRVHPLTQQLLEDLAQDTAGRSFSHGVRELVDQAAERKDKVVAVVESAVPLDTEQRGRLVAALGRIYHREVAVHTVVSPTLVGGLRIRVGDEVIDGSVAGRLAALRARLAS